MSLLNGSAATHFEAGRTTILHRPYARFEHFRIASERYSTLQVYAFDFASVPEITKLKELEVPGTYVLANSSFAYVGETGEVGNRLCEHKREAKRQFADHVIVITSKDASYNKEQAVFGQKHLYERAEAAGLVTLVNEGRPHEAKLKIEDASELRRALIELERPLFDAGCRLLGTWKTRPAAAAILPKAEPPTAEEQADTGGMQIGTKLVVLEEHQELRYSDLKVIGCQYQNRFIILPGSEVRDACNDSVEDSIQRFREDLAQSGVLAAIDGVDDRKRLTVALTFTSRLTAGMVCAGAKIRSVNWARSEATTRSTLDMG
jgi:hypothetical protein